ncbi:MAG: VOC family protein [Nakamurella sp.]
MSISFQVTMDATDPGALAEFWKLALGYRSDDPPPGFANWEEALADVPEEHRNDANAVIDPDGVGPRLFFLKVPEGKNAKNRVHLDVGIGKGIADPDARFAKARAHADALIIAGGTEVEERRDNWGGHWITLLDPEGNEFCVQ